MANLSLLRKLLLATVRLVEAGLLQTLSWWVAKPPPSSPGGEPTAWAGLLTTGRLEPSAKSLGELKIGSAGRCYRSNLTGEVWGDYVQLRKEGQKGMRWSHLVCNRNTSWETPGNWDVIRQLFRKRTGCKAQPHGEVSGREQRRW